LQLEALSLTEDGRMLTATFGTSSRWKSGTVNTQSEGGVDAHAVAAASRITTLPLALTLMPLGCRSSQSSKVELN
jgi:hypothetical protein